MSPPALAPALIECAGNLAGRYNAGQQPAVQIKRIQPLRPAPLHGVVAKFQGIVLVRDTVSACQATEQPVCLVQGVGGIRCESLRLKEKQLGQARAGAVGATGCGGNSGNTCGLGR